MKTLALFALVAMATVGALAQIPDGWVKLPNGDTVAKSQAERRKKLAADKMAELQDEGWLYHKWSDGTITYAGRYYLMHYGLIPEEETRVGVRFLFYGYKIYDVSKNGCRIAEYKSQYTDSISDNDFFVEGLTGFSGRSYGSPVLFRLIGHYEYSTVNGSSRTIPRYEVGEQATAQDYAAFLKRGKPVDPDSKTEAPKTNGPSLINTSTNSTGTFGPDTHGKPKNYKL